MTGREAGSSAVAEPFQAPTHTVAVLWPVVFPPPLTFHSLLLGPGLNLFIAKVRDIGKILHLLEVELFLSLKSLSEYTELGLLFFFVIRAFLLPCAALYRSGWW